MYTQVTLILIFFNVQYLQNVFLSFYKDFSHSMVKITRHIPTGKYKIPPLQQNFIFPHWGEIPSYPLMTHSIQISYCVKSLQILSFSGPYFPVFRLNTEIYGVNFRIKSEYRKIRTRKTPYLDIFHAVSQKQDGHNIYLTMKKKSPPNNS